MNILLIAGHGGSDPGACAFGYREAELTREFAGLLQKELLEFAKVDLHDVSADAYTKLKNGGSIPFKNYDYMLEIHFNAGGGKGTEILVHTSESVISVEQRIVNSVAMQGFSNRGVKNRADLLVMNTCAKQGVPCALLEVCFIDNPVDMDNYQDKKQAIAVAVARAIKEGFGLKGKEDEPMTSIEKSKFNELVNAVSELAGRVDRLANPAIYNYIDKNMPEYARETVAKLVEKGVLKGNENGLNLDENMLRILTVLDRAGVFD